MPDAIAVYLTLFSVPYPNSNRLSQFLLPLGRFPASRFHGSAFHLSRSRTPVRTVLRGRNPLAAATSAPLMPNPRDDDVKDPKLGRRCVSGNSRSAQMVNRLGRGAWGLVRLKTGIGILMRWMSCIIQCSACFKSSELHESTGRLGVNPANILDRA